MAGIAHAAMVDRSVSEAIAWGQRAAALAEDAADELVPPVYAAFGYACFLAGDLAGAVDAAQRAIEHHQAEQRVPAHLGAQAVLALARAEGGHPEAAEAAATAATAIATDVGLAETWVGALAAAARATVLERRGDLAEAEQEAKRSARLNSGVSLAGEAWALGLLARIRGRRGRLADAEGALSAMRSVVAEMTDPGRLQTAIDSIGAELATARTRAGSGGLLQSPTKAELAVLHLLASDLSMRQIGDQLFLSRNTVKSHARALYRKLGVGSRPDAVMRAETLGLLEVESPGW
jgi:LuxR family maltose regulon positive regulatory protein